MDSQIAKDLDQILTVLGNHFRPEHRMSDTQSFLIGAVGILIILAAGYGLWRNGRSYTSEDVARHEAQVAFWRMVKAQYDAQIDNIDAMYQAVVNPSARAEKPVEMATNYGNPNRLPPPRKIGTKNNYGPGWVYLIAGDGAHKIGLATDPEARLSNLQTASHKQLAMVHKIKTNNMRALEAELHRKYADKRLNGEWFALAPVDVAEICLIKDEVAA